MKPRNRLSTRSTVLVVAISALVSACTTLVSPSDSLAPLDLALSGDPVVLREQADEGDAEAQLAMSIVAAEGLGGRAVDVSEAIAWREQALSNRRIMPITQYTAAFNGNPSRVNIIHVPVSVIQPGQVAAIERCIGALRTQSEAIGLCGGTRGEVDARRAAWSAARR